MIGTDYSGIPLPQPRDGLPRPLPACARGGRRNRRSPGSSLGRARYRRRGGADDIDRRRSGRRRGPRRSRGGLCETHHSLAAVGNQMRDRLTSRPPRSAGGSLRRWRDRADHRHLWSRPEPISPRLCSRAAIASSAPFAVPPEPVSAGFGGSPSLATLSSLTWSCSKKATSADWCLDKLKPDGIYNLAASSFASTSRSSSPCSPPPTSWDPLPACFVCSEAMRDVRPGARFYQASTSEMFGKGEQETRRQRGVAP